MKSKIFSLVLSLLLSATFIPAASAQSVEEKPSAGGMFVDLVVARPLLLGVTAVGTVAYVASLPFSLLGGNAGEAGKTLVVGPAKATFLRCLGCKNSRF